VPSSSSPAAGRPSLWTRVRDGWIARSLAVGAVGTVLGMGLGVVLLALGGSARWAAMAGTVLGATFAYFANRRFAFPEFRGGTGGSALRFALVTVASIAVHGQLVVWLMGLGLPFLVAKVAADFIVFNLGQLVLLRYLVFPGPGKPVAPHGVRE
jgi:putative flippase GtrA